MEHALKHLSDKDFKQTIAQGITLVDFYADWCGPCRMIAPIIEELAAEYQGRVTVAKVDVDNAQETSARLNVTSIPTVILFVNGEKVKEIVGVKDKKSYQAILDTLVNN